MGVANSPGDQSRICLHVGNCSRCNVSHMWTTVVHTLCRYILSIQRILCEQQWIRCVATLYRYNVSTAVHIRIRCIDTMYRHNVSTAVHICDTLHRLKFPTWRQIRLWSPGELATPITLLLISAHLHIKASYLPYQQFTQLTVISLSVVEFIYLTWFIQYNTNHIGVHKENYSVLPTL